MSADPQKVRVVFDCMLFLQGAARRESPAGICLLLAELGAVELCISTAIMDEIRDVLTRPRVREKFPSLTDDLVNQFSGGIAVSSDIDCERASRVRVRAGSEG